MARLATVPAHDIPRAVLTLPLSRGRRAFLALSFAFAQRVNFHWLISSVLSLDLAHFDCLFRAAVGQHSIEQLLEARVLICEHDGLLQALWH